MIPMPAIYALVGTLFAVFAILSVADRTNPKRWTTGLFWGLFAVSFLAGDFLGDLGNGVLVLCMALIAGGNGLGVGQPATTTIAERQASARAWGNMLFVPALVITVITVAGTIAIKGFSIGPITIDPILINGFPIADPKLATPVALAFGSIVAAVLALVMLRQPPASPFQEGRRLMDIIGWAALLPQMLASLGAVFAVAGMGQVIGSIAAAWVPSESLIAAVIVYCVGMALFTMIMGNAFAAFPVLTAGVGIPFLIQHFHGDPAVVAAIGMLAGFCGTLMTPLAANFNIVPAALLDLKDRNGVIYAQIPTALAMLAINTLLMYVLAFR
ncbi:MAG: DUF979 domain-containing protein [Alphaproteobacteria bacterium]|jgi:uncharacterized membrane protein|nr:DUF979 domain-containing protein [Alphaproteobacteria bacterium]